MKSMPHSHLRTACSSTWQACFPPQTLRQVLCLSNSDEEKLGLYGDACTLIRDMPPASFPGKEVAWLVTTCFNRGCQHAKFLRHDSALDFMQVPPPPSALCDAFDDASHSLTAPVCFVVMSVYISLCGFAISVLHVAACQLFQL